VGDRAGAGETAATAQVGSSADGGRESSRTPGAVSMAERVFAEQIRLLYKPTVPLVVNVLNAAIIAAVFWPIAPDLWLSLWFVAVALTVAARMLLCRDFARNRKIHSNRTWAIRFAIGAGVTGTLWGATAIAIPLTGEPLYHMLVGLTTAGMGAGAVASLAVHLPSFHAFLLPCMLPTAAAFIAAGDPAHQGLGVMVLVFATAIAFIARGSNRALVETLRLRFRNADLAQELSVAQDIAEQAGRSNSETLAHLSHEMRTPLNAIGGFAEMMRRRVFGTLGHEKYAEYVDDIAESSSHLTNLVEEILLYSRGHAGTLRLDEEDVDVASEIGNCIQMIAHVARDGGISVTAEIAPRLPRLRADPVKLRQILVNLMSNAVKFTPPPGRVTVRAFTEPGGGMVLQVSDTGIGIEAADLERVMEPYVQLQSAFVRKSHPGLGLGLPIVKHLVALHAAALELVSEPGRGTTVTVRFPPERTVGR